MALTITDAVFTEEEYIAYELSSEEKHEYINGKLITMPGEKDLNNEIAGNIFILLKQFLKSKGYNVYIEGVKVKIPGEPKYYYPDVFATKEATGGAGQYIKHEPEMIIEVLSDRTRRYDMVDKFINYQKIPSLHYYLLVEPEKILVQLFYKENGDWEVISFTDMNDMIYLPLLQIQFTVSEIYELK